MVLLVCSANIILLSSFFSQMYLNVSIYKHNKGKVMAINGHDLTSVRFSAHLCGSTAWLIVYSKTAAIDRTGICIFIAM